MPGALAASALAALALTGCAGMSGLGGSSEFKCSAPTGIPCRSVTAVDLADRAGTAPDEPSRSAAERDRRNSATRPPVPPEAWTGADANGVQPQPLRVYHTGTQALPQSEGPGPAAIRSAPTQLRMWIAPWKDSDGDLHDESYVFMVIDNGRWLVEHNRERIRKAFAPRAADAVATAAPARSEATAGAGAAGQPPSNATRTPDEVTAALARSAGMAEAERKRLQAGQVGGTAATRGAQP